MKKLFLLRHAKSSWEDPNLSDFERPLNARGIKNALDLCTFFQRQNISPDKVLVSTSHRTLETLELVGSHFSADIIEKSNAIYHASLEQLITLIKPIKDCSTLLLIGHNPSMHQFTEMLTDTSLRRFPTYALAEIEISSDWSGINKASHNLLNFLTPKDYANN